MLDSFLDRRHGRARSLGLSRGWTVAILDWSVGVMAAVLLVLDLVFQKRQIEIPQGIWSEASLVISGDVLGHKIVGLQLLGDSVKDV